MLTGFNAMQGHKLLETIYGHPLKGLPLWTFHAQRIEKSCQYFNLPVLPLAGIYQQLLAKTQNDTTKIRLLYNWNAHNQKWEWEIEAELIPVNYNQLYSLKTTTLNKNQLFLPHLKTTNRTVFNEAYQNAVQQNYDDALLINEHQQIMDTSRANLVLLQGNVLKGPAVESGALPGVMLAYLQQCNELKNYTWKTEAVTSSDLHEAEAVFMINALRGIMLVEKIDKQVFDVTPIKNLQKKIHSCLFA